ncbi:MAG: WHG domain-containing protein [Anaerolineales bacterium]|nr:WHG domain-containing protein [Anaerolineales bacterium]
MVRKTRARLDKGAVIQAAVELVNADGMQALTLGRLAGELGIQTPSLYNHIDGLPGLQKDMAVLNAKLLADRLSEAAVGKSGSDLFMEVAQAFRNYVKEYAGLYMSTLRSSGTQDVQDEDLVREEERAMKIGTTVMASLGLKGKDAIHALRAFRSMVHGFATLEVAGGFGLPLECDESFRRLVTALSAGLQKN